MYKKLVAVSLFSATFLASAGMMTTLSAQDRLEIVPTPSSKQFIMPIGVQCDTKGSMSNVIGQKYKETPFTTGDGTMTVMTPQGPTVLPGIVKLWANPETWSFSITIEDPSPNNDVMCMLTSGKGLAPNSSIKGDDL
jgi:hypothetical protein